MSTLDANVRTTDLRRAYRRVHRFERLLGAMAFLAGVGFFFDPSLNPGNRVANALPGFLDDAWHLSYLFGGLLVFAGVQRRAATVERAGLFLMAGGVSVNFVAGLAVSGPTFGLGVLAVVAFELLARLRDLSPDWTFPRGPLAIALPIGVAVVAAAEPGDPVLYLVGALLLGSFGGGTAVLINGWRQRRQGQPQVNASTAHEEVEALRGVVAEYRIKRDEDKQMIERLERQCRRHEREIEALQDVNLAQADRIGALEARLTTGGSR